VSRYTGSCCFEISIDIQTTKHLLNNYNKLNLYLKLYLYIKYIANGKNGGLGVTAQKHAITELKQEEGAKHGKIMEATLVRDILKNPNTAIHRNVQAVFQLLV